MNFCPDFIKYPKFIKRPEFIKQSNPAKAKSLSPKKFLCGFDFVYGLCDGVFLAFYEF